VEHDKPSPFWLLAFLGALVSTWALLAPKKETLGQSVQPQDRTGDEQKGVPPPVSEFHPEAIKAISGKEKSEHRPDWSKVAAIAQTLAVPVALGLVWVTFLQTQAVVITAENGKKELELSQRPWVSITDIEVIRPLVFDSNGAHTTIRYAFTNTGRSPAIDGYPLWDFMVPYGDTPSPVYKRDSLCKAAGYTSERISARGIGKLSRTFVPGQPQPMTFLISWNVNDIKKAMIDIP
jgi:hypothetical protein